MAPRANPDGLQYDGTYPALWDEFVLFYCDPQRSCSMKEWAEAHGRAYGTVVAWPRTNPTIRRLIEKRYAELNVDPERIQRVVDALWTAACDGDTKAAALYLQFTERLQPTQRIVVEDKRVEGLSDDELDAELRAMVRDASL